MQRTSTEVNIYMRRHQRRILHTYVGNMIYHKFSRDDISYRFNLENVNVMFNILEYVNIIYTTVSILIYIKTLRYVHKVFQMLYFFRTYLFGTCRFSNLNTSPFETVVSCDLVFHLLTLNFTQRISLRPFLNRGSMRPYKNGLISPLMK